MNKFDRLTLLFIAMAMAIVSIGAMVRMETLVAEIRSLTLEVRTLVQIADRKAQTAMNELTLTYPSTGGPHTTHYTIEAGLTYAQAKARLDAKVATDQAGEWPYVPPGS
jgi:hypothetical protein